MSVKLVRPGPFTDCNPCDLPVGNVGASPDGALWLKGENTLVCIASGKHSHLGEDHSSGRPAFVVTDLGPLEVTE